MPDNASNRRADEDDLLRRARTLDESALGAIFDAYYEPLYRYVYRHLGSGPQAEDLAAEVFHSFLAELRHGRGPTTYLRGWLYRVAHNLMVDEVRRNRHEHELLDEERRAPGHDVGDQVQSALAQQDAKRALKQLTDKQRAVLELKYLQGLQIDEIAQALKMTTGTVKALQHRGLQAMRRFLKHSGAIDETDL